MFGQQSCNKNITANFHQKIICLQMFAVQNVSKSLWRILDYLGLWVCAAGYWSCLTGQAGIQVAALRPGEAESNILKHFVRLSSCLDTVIIQKITRERLLDNI